MRNIYLIGGIFVILHLMLIIFIIFPLIRDIKKTSTDLILQQFEIFLLEQSKENIENLRKVYQTHQRDLEKIEASFVDPEIPIDFIRFLEKTAADSRVGIKISLTEGGSIPPSGLSFNIFLESSFPNFLRFLERVENGSYSIEVSNANIKRTIEGQISIALILSTLAKE